MISIFNNSMRSIINSRKIGFFILMISVIGNSKSSEIEKTWLLKKEPGKISSQEEKDLSLCNILWQNGLEIDGTQIYCPDYNDKEKMHEIEIADLQRFFLRKTPSPNEKLSFSRTDYLKVLAYSPDKFPKSFSEINYYIGNFDINDDEKFEKIKKIKIEKNKKKKKWWWRNKESWEGFWNNVREVMKREIGEWQLTRDYLEKNAKSDKEREEIFRIMINKVIKNWEKIKKTVLTESPDKQEVIELLKLPLGLRQLPELIAFKSLQ